MRFIKLLINIYISKSLMAYHQLLFAPIPLCAADGELAPRTACTKTAMRPARAGGRTFLGVFFLMDAPT